MITLFLYAIIISWQPVPTAEGYLVTVCDGAACVETDVGAALIYDAPIPEGRVVSVRAYNQGGNYQGPKSTEVVIGSLGKPISVVKED